MQQYVLMFAEVREGCKKMQYLAGFVGAVRNVMTYEATCEFSCVCRPMRLNCYRSQLYKIEAARGDLMQDGTIATLVL